MAGQFHYLEHPSDIGFLARGATREEALVAAGQALGSILVDADTVVAREERELRGAGADEAARVVAWLTEVLYWFDAEGLVFRDFAVDRWDEREIVGRARGERLDPARHELRTSVKAVTYHQFHCGPTDGQWEIRVFVDL
jgi:SHS2 domain-containing protein